MKNRLATALICLPFLFLRLPASAAERPAAYFSFHMDPASVSGGEVARLEVEAYRTEITAAGFRIQVSFDEDKLAFLGTETSGAVKSGTMRTNGSSGQITCVYVCNADKGYAPQLSGTVASFLFQAEPDAAEEETTLTVETDQICDYDGSPLETDRGSAELELKLSPALSSKARLTALEPSAGTLVPEFSPSATEYCLSVGSGVGSVEFRADAAEGGAVRVSRKTLNAAGKETQIVVTVTSADRSETAQYLVHVERMPKETAPAAVSDRPEKTSERADDSSPENGRSRPPAEIENKETAAQKKPAAGTGDKGDGPEEREDADAAPSAAPLQIAEAPRETEENRTTLILTGDRMPSYLVGMLACALCVTVGSAVSLWLPIRSKK